MFNMSPTIYRTGSHTSNLVASIASNGNPGTGPYRRFGPLHLSSFASLKALQYESADIPTTTDEDWRNHADLHHRASDGLLTMDS
ncbi:uncharacterized protein BKA78DRAFT_136689 [Phyllosticta capitalensis]|uniref:uncharacterized protein n=1 Tax=Phyllosticta capitalensis TaxID=121624 RepID=UPI00312D4797